jgi:ankyrin repeat protein
VAALLDAGADPSLASDSGCTALDSAHANGRAGTAALLAERLPRT